MSKLIYLVGLSGSGKSTYAKIIQECYPEAVIFSSDAMRAEMWGDESDQRAPHKIFEELNRRVRLHLSKGGTAIYDSTGLSSKRRKALIQYLRPVARDATFACHVVATNFNTCVLRDEKRADSKSRSVGYEVILKQIKSFQMPHYIEGWDQIGIIRDKQLTGEYYLLSPVYQYNLSHYSPHHEESIQQHMLSSAALAMVDRVDQTVITALLYHDIGKILTRTFTDSHGNPTDVAHYYGHENVSAYMFLTSEEWSDIKKREEVLYLIQYHMRVYFDGYEKFKQQFSEDFIEKLELVHKYDEMGRAVRLTNV